MSAQLKLIAGRFVCDEGGASLVEYVLLIALIAVVALGGIKAFGTATANKLAENGNSVTNAINAQ